MPCPEHNECLAHCQIRWREVKGMLKIYQLRKGDKPNLRMEYRVWKCRNQNSLGGQNKSWKGEWAKLGWALCALPRFLYCKRVLLWISATLKFLCFVFIVWHTHTYSSCCILCFVGLQTVLGTKWLLVLWSLSWYRLWLQPPNSFH